MVRGGLLSVSANPLALCAALTESHQLGQYFCSLKKSVSTGIRHTGKLGIRRLKWEWQLETGRDEGTWCLESS